MSEKLFEIEKITQNVRCLALKTCQCKTVKNLTGCFWNFTCWIFSTTLIFSRTFWKWYFHL